MQLLNDVLLGNTVGTDAIAPWNAKLEPTKGIIPQLDANRAFTGVGGQEVNAQSLTPDNSDNIILPDASLSQMTNAVITNSNASLSDSDVDVLIGQAMSEVHGDLSKFAAQADFVDGINLAFGENWDAAGAKALAEEWYKGNFSDIPPLKFVSSAEIGSANGAFAATTDTIYLSKEFLARNVANPAAVADVLLEEIGHSVDSQLNVTDSPGDEGAIFGAIVQGKELSEGELQGLKSEDDTANVLFNGQVRSIEKAGYDWGNRWYVQAFDTANSYKSLIEYDLGSNTRNDGKKGLVQDWGSSSPKPGIIPNDFFALAFWTQADFQQGETYNFNVRADDSYALAALPVGAQDSNQWEFITQWKWNEDAYGGKTVQFTPKNSGKYWVLEYYRERDGKAYFDTSWEKTGQASSGSASTLITPISPGFNPIKNSKGVTLYESNNKSDYVQVVDLSQGASIKLLTGEKDNNTSNGAYGGTSPKFKHQTIDTFWDQLSSSNSNAFSIANGAFFTDFRYDFRNLFDDKTNLSYPLKIDSQVFDGSKSENIGSKLKLEIWKDKALITPFDDQIISLYNSSAPQVIVGNPKQTKGQKSNPNALDGRTYVGVEDRDSNGSNETVLILTSKDDTQTTTGAVKILKDFGVNDNEIMQLDGSGSTQMKAQGQKFVEGDGRWIPQAIGVVSGS